MTRRKNTFIGLAVLGAGVAAGVALERLVYRRVFPRDDPERNEKIGSWPGETVFIDSFDGTKIHARIYGPSDAPALVMAHGVLNNHELWHYQVKDLSDSYRIIAYDARGHGRSGPARGPDGSTSFTAANQARDMVAVVEQLTTGPVVLIGHSMGGMTVQSLWQEGLIAALADRVTAIALLNATYTTDLSGWRGSGTRRERAYERVEDIVQRLRIDPRIIERIRPGRSDLTMLIARFVFGANPSATQVVAALRMYQSMPSATITAAVDLAHFDTYEILPEVDVPALVIAGSRDLVTPAWLSEELATRIREAELVVFESCGHMSPFERYDEVNESLRKFCGRLDRGDAAPSRSYPPEPPT